ncbi:hypothetical protein M422DRAFT_773713 [Sphaerobolus stellatus SS14]|nr:hypothetical protein M422DRAFT_773713 [Sphaerobolus stellatus SS14]
MSRDYFLSTEHIHPTFISKPTSMAPPPLSAKAPTLHFNIEDRTVSIEEFDTFWEDSREWLASCGYYLFDFTDLYIPTIPYEDSIAQFPHAHVCGRDPSCPEVHPAFGRDRVAFAQDRDGRHYAIKIVPNPSTEYDIMKYISNNMAAAKDNHIMPVCEMLPFQDHCFAVMPRWGENPIIPWLPKISDMLLFIHCTLKAISYLHTNGIVHQDLKIEHFIPNHLGTATSGANYRSRLMLHERHMVTYALFDFDLSLFFPPDIASDPRKRRLPFTHFYQFGHPLPNDVAQGELDYDPFVMEMGNLGILLARYFQLSVVQVPLLAPFFDGLLTDNLSKRFTAPQALAFFENVMSAVSPDVMKEAVPFPNDPQWDKYDRWAKVPHSIQTQWSSYRISPPSLFTRLLRKICSTRIGLKIMFFIRKTLCIGFRLDS